MRTLHNPFYITDGMLGMGSSAISAYKSASYNNYNNFKWIPACAGMTTTTTATTTTTMTTTTNKMDTCLRRYDKLTTTTT
ncbi:MAG: hypothetical protein LBU09_01540 [Endomicrobium sp.]|nr:hypothetical protein [Endomicrobium sp.]